ncbi:hypothetical protein H5410_002212 [Solanum commersonii]|uniref:Uncharacterized protein n=1 Tax=Solanum commersonii TaxID=4109 RepID=A0A9J6B291_SOLCO|nr:hypothetical protein H5410_002212 [Solanum commersonii]
MNILLIIVRIKLRRCPPFVSQLDNMKKEIRVLYKRDQDLKVLLTPTEDEEFDACFDADLTNNLGQKKEHLEAMRQKLINYKLCLDFRFYLFI